MTKGTRIIGYLRCSTDEQGESRAGLDAQRAQIQAEADRRGWVVTRYEEDIASGKSTNGRHGLERAITSLRASESDALVAAKLDRLSRSTIDFLKLVDQSKRERWTLVVLDIGDGHGTGLDLTTPMGEMMATVLAAFAQFERKQIGKRTSDALAAKRARGESTGRPLDQIVPSDVRQRIVQLRGDGMSRYAIANQLNREGVPTAAGGARWYPSTIKRVLDADRD